MRECRDCRETLPLERFGKDAARADGLNVRCRDCVAARSRRYREANPEKARAASKRWRAENPERVRELASNYRARNAERLTQRRRAHAVGRHGLTLEQFDSLLERQGGVCAICQTVPGDSVPWAVDHDHRCCPGKYGCPICIRGILCLKCNTGLGAFDEDPQRLARAVRYLRKEVQIMKVRAIKYAGLGAELSAVTR